jgi:hypothetical protein
MGHVMFPGRGDGRCSMFDEDCTPCNAAAGGSPFPLCPAHLAAVVDWAEGEFGVPDVLPGACPLCGSTLGVRYPSGWVCAACEWRLGDTPDDGLPAPRVDVVYYIRFRDRIKIGTTANPRQRLGRLWHEELLAFEQGDRLVEHRRHQEFASSRLGRSEWFGASSALEEHIDRLSAGVDDPWARYARWVGQSIGR